MSTDLVYAICSMSDIPSQRAASFQLAKVGPDGRDVPLNLIVVRWGRQVFGYENRCPHHGSNLDWERNHFFDPNGTRLMCGKHGALFELHTGNCVDGPCKGESLTPVALAVLEDEICIVGVELAEDADEDDGLFDPPGACADQL
ncbi:(2Fe-2S)-binding protein [Azorhizobium oxalatiphilum]|uniref:(2Fe-2S)-binding protein n=1 Tax=Azorhizobium oxalatiphilum TaxID=980631 RepID=A0A917BPT4_9HYPH|nr:Rieske 2Fe-2S domain-containing protein [Azorhizobium oxalatiphilum]GGF52016.1 (2Fe-2S)-binding protein [Azorhizobium oxalatiphilum]